MTRPFGQTICCQHCSKETTVEDEFSRWTRSNPRLDSNTEGIVILNIDRIVHRYKTYISEMQNRQFQCMMFLEIKIHGASLTDAQLDTLDMTNQILRNRRQTPTKPLRHERGRSPLSVYSAYSNGIVNLRFYGIHLLRFSGRGPKDSATIWWDKQQIDIETLEALLRFNLDPDTLAPLDLRSHHAARQTKQLPMGFDNEWIGIQPIAL